MRMSRAAVMIEHDRPLEIRKYPLPAAIEPGAALVRVQLAGVCGTDVHLWHGRLSGVPYPIIPGHVSAGTIEAARGPANGDSSQSDQAFFGSVGPGRRSRIPGPSL